MIAAGTQLIIYECSHGARRCICFACPPSQRLLLREHCRYYSNPGARVEFLELVDSCNNRQNSPRSQKVKPRPIKAPLNLRR